jgi:hypothetical protein
MANAIANFFYNCSIFSHLHTIKVEINKYVWTLWTLATLVINSLIIIFKGDFQLWSMCEWISFVDIEWHHPFIIIVKGHFQLLDGIHLLTLHDIIKHIIASSHLLELTWKNVNQYLNDTWHIHIHRLGHFNIKLGYVTWHKNIGDII